MNAPLSGELSEALLASWLLAIIVCSALIIGYYSYVSIKRKFDESYGHRGILYKRVIHGIVYMIFLVLAYEGVTIRLRGEVARVVLFLVYLLLSFIALFIFGDIVVSTYRIMRGESK